MLDLTLWRVWWNAFILFLFHIPCNYWIVLPPNSYLLKNTPVSWLCTFYCTHRRKKWLTSLAAHDIDFNTLRLYLIWSSLCIMASHYIVCQAVIVSVRQWSPRWSSGKASTSRAEGPGFKSRLRQDFFGVESYQWLKNCLSSGYPARRQAL